MHWLLLYDLAPDYLERRAAHRAEHLALAREAHARGDLLLADPADAILLFRDPDTARAFAEADPYVAAGLVLRPRVRAWNTVVGEGATPPSL